jgi:Bacterial extracellular solute-binding proteins, family 3
LAIIPLPFELRLPCINNRAELLPLDSSIPLSYLDDNLLPVGFSIELCKHVVEAVKAKLGMPSLKVVYNPVTSATRIPLVANGTVDIECGSTANMTSRQRSFARRGKGSDRRMAATLQRGTSAFEPRLSHAERVRGIPGYRS